MHSSVAQCDEIFEVDLVNEVPYDTEGDPGSWWNVWVISKWAVGGADEERIMDKMVYPPPSAIRGSSQERSGITLIIRQSTSTSW